MWESFASIYKVSVILEEAFIFYVRIREYMYLMQTIILNSRFTLPDDLLVTSVVKGCLPTST